jgi:Zn-dependent protease
MLGWSINLFRVFGIQLAVHASFLLLLAYYGYDGWVAGGVPGLLWSVGLILLFFVCVILHELGHSLTARRYGVNVSRILLLPIGGMAQFDRIPRKPSQELLITVAGPAVNFALVAILLPLVWRNFFSDLEDSSYSLLDLGTQLCAANLVMGTFNLLPVFPMDGGRIFRALLAMKLPYLRATYWAVTVGKVLAVIFAALAAFYFKNPVSCVLFLFIFWAGDAEYKQTLHREEEERYWAELARRVPPVESAPSGAQPPPLIYHGPN